MPAGTSSRDGQRLRLAMRAAAARLHGPACSGPCHAVRSSVCPRSHASVGRMRRPHRAHVTSPRATRGAQRRRSALWGASYPRSAGARRARSTAARSAGHRPPPSTRAGQPGREQTRNGRRVTVGAPCPSLRSTLRRATAGPVKDAHAPLRGALAGILDSASARLRAPLWDRPGVWTTRAEIRGGDMRTGPLLG
jgi:hypothetical protein